MKNLFVQRSIEIFVAFSLGTLMYLSTRDSFGIESILISASMIGATYLLTTHYFKEFGPVEHHSHSPTASSESANKIETANSYSIIFLDKNGNIQTWDKGAQRIWGHEGTEIIGQHFSRLYPDNSYTSGEFKNFLLNALVNGLFEDEGLRQTNKGHLQLVHTIINPSYDTKRNHKGYLIITRALEPQVVPKLAQVYA